MATMDILGQLINKDTIAQLASGSDADESQVESLLSSALPMMMQKMAGNASTKAGKASLNKALNDHAAKTETTDVKTLLRKADTDDGQKILGHLLGGDKDDITSALAKKNGMKGNDVTMLLATLAPTLLGLVGNEKKKVKEDDDADDFDLGGLIGGLAGFGGNSGSSMMLDLAGELLGGSTGKKKKKKNDTADLVGGLLGKLLK